MLYGDRLAKQPEGFAPQSSRDPCDDTAVSPGGGLCRCTARRRRGVERSSGGQTTRGTRRYTLARGRS